MTGWSWVPNTLSLARLLAGLAFPFLPLGWRLPVVLGAAVTDALDGVLSRWLNAQSALGRLLDPVADKVFVVAVVLSLLVEGTLTPVEAVLASFRDLAVSLGAVYALATTGGAAASRMRPALLGKATTWAQFLFLLVVLIQGRSWLGQGLLGVTAVLGLLATIDYVRRYRHRAPPTAPATRTPEEG